MTKKSETDLTAYFIEDAGLGIESLRKVVRKNYEMLAHRDVKTFKDLEKFLQKTHITPKEAATTVARHVKQGSNWNKYQILRARSELKWIKFLVRMRKKLGTKRLLDSAHLEAFSDATGYEIPKDLKTFRNNVWEMRKAIGAERKKDGSFTAARMEKELLSKLKNKNRKKPGGKHGR